MSDILVLLNTPFFVRALAAGVLVSVVCSALGVFVVLRGWSFLGAGISHSAFAGVALGLLLGINPLLVAMLFCSLVAVGVGTVSRAGKVSEDTSIGIFFASTMALGFVLISFTSNPNVDVMGYLFGNILAVSRDFLVIAGATSSVILGILLLFYKEFVLLAFDEELAPLCRIPARALNLLLLVLIAVAIVLSVRVVGIILVSALLVTPAATALQLARDFDRVMLLAVAVGVATTVVGLFASYFLDIGPGAAITLLGAAVFVLTAGMRRCWRSN